MKYSREYILRRAFDVFMNKGYDSTSISVLQEELNMSRGALYRYFKNKEELLIAVVDTYFFGLFEKLLKNVPEGIPVSEHIELMHRRQKVVLNAFNRAGITHTAFLNYTGLMIQAAKYYPEFLERFRETNGKLIENWRKALRKSVEINEVRSDINIDILCTLFNSSSVRESSDRSDDESMFSINVMRDMEKRKEVTDYLFSLIKI